MKKWSYVYKEQALRPGQARPMINTGIGGTTSLTTQRAQTGPLRHPRGAGSPKEAEAVMPTSTVAREGRPVLITSDAYPVYEESIRHVYGEEVTTTPRNRPRGRMIPERVPPELI